MIETQTATGLAIDCIRENLLPALDLATKVVSRRSTLPVLSNVLLRTEDAQLIVSSTDLEIAASQQVSGRVRGEGAITVPVKALRDFIKSFAKGSLITLDMGEDDKLIVTADARRTVIQGINADEYPIFTGNSSTPIWVDAHGFAEAIRRVEFALIRDKDVRPILEGMSVELDDSKTFAGRYRLVACDNYRIAIAGNTYSMGKLDEYKRFLPIGRGMRLLASLVKKGGAETLTLAAGKNNLVAQLGRVTLLIRTVDGIYPNWQQVLPGGDPQAVATVRTSELLPVVTAAAGVAQNAANVIRFTFDDGGMGGHMVVRAKADTSEFESPVASAGYQGDGFTWSFSAPYMLDLLRVADEQLRIEFFGDMTNSPAQFTDGTGWRVVLMPVRTP